MSALYVYGVLDPNRPDRGRAALSPVQFETAMHASTDHGQGDHGQGDHGQGDHGLGDRGQGERGLEAATVSDLGEGVGGGAVFLLPAGSLTVLVSPIPPGPVAQVRRNMVAHTSVLERVTAQTDILPLRFGTVAPDAATLATCVADNAEAFRGALEEIGGKVELGLKASWREGVVFSEIVAADAELCRLRDRLRSRPAAETYYERVELGRRVEAALVDRRSAETTAIIAELSPLAEREAELRTLDEDMILNRAFLVRRENEAAFDARVQAVSERRAARINFRYVGPVPPYNFIRLQVGWLAGAA